MKFGTSQVESDGPITVDNAFRPGKGSRPRPLVISKDELGRRLDAIFGWSSRRTRRGKAGAK
jgi:hypothetical protein